MITAEKMEFCDNIHDIGCDIQCECSKYSICNAHYRYWILYLQWI